MTDDTDSEEERIEKRIYEEAMTKGDGFAVAYGLIQVAAALNAIANAIYATEQA